MGIDIDPQLLQRLRAYDEEAQWAFWDEHGEAVRSYVSNALARNGCREDAEEIIQNTFVRAFGDIGRFRRQSSVTTWLFTLARHAATDYYRSPKNRCAAAYPERFSSLDDPRAARRTARGDADVSSGPILEERRERIRDHLTALQQEHRDVLTLRIAMKLSTKETAQIMACARDALRHRRRGQLVYPVLLFARQLLSEQSRLAVTSHRSNR